jgi:choline kinase
MVYSMFLPSKYIKDDVVVCYGDIIFDYKIYKLLEKNDNIIPLNINWLKIWKKRMSKKKIKNDAENLHVKNNVLKSIGGKIDKTYPKYQYMGIFKIKKIKYLL